MNPDPCCPPQFSFAWKSLQCGQRVLGSRVIQLTIKSLWSFLSHLAIVPYVLTLSAGRPEKRGSGPTSDIMTGTTSHLLTVPSLKPNTVCRP